jgi:hypothetical protein
MTRLKPMKLLDKNKALAAVAVVAFAAIREQLGQKM